jgi:hypothetical protein
MKHAVVIWEMVDLSMNLGELSWETLDVLPPPQYDYDVFVQDV